MLADDIGIDKPGECGGAWSFQGPFGLSLSKPAPEQTPAGAQSVRLPTLVPPQT